MIYFDNAATTRALPAVAEKMSTMLCEQYGNPASVSAMGLAAEKEIRNAAEIIARGIHCKYDEVFFTSGGTDLPTKQQNQELFGGGGGGGITITPVAFIVIEKGKCRMMQINNYTSSADRAVSMIPELVDKLTELLKAKDGKADEAETPAAE